MCGACGRPVTADPVFPDGRTTRGNLIAAQIINQLCPSAPARVKVVGHAEGFLVSAPGRPQELCWTVAEAWAAVLAADPAAGLGLERAPDELRPRYCGTGDHPLLEAVTAAGQAAARAQCGVRPSAGPSPD